MKMLLWFALGVAVIAALHQLALWAERRGWIYYKYRRASPGTSSNAFLEVQSMLQPGTRHVVESRLEKHADADESGDPPPGTYEDDDGVGSDR